METPFMEVIRFDVENVIATSGGSGAPTASYSINDGAYQHTCDHVSDHRYTVGTTSMGAVYGFSYNDEGVKGLDFSAFPTNYESLPVVMNQYYYKDGVWKVCDSGQ